MNIEKTITEMIANRVKKYGSKILFQHKDGWSWKQVTWLDFDKGVKDAASFLLSLGFNAGDTALMISGRHMESLWAESAVYLLGGILVPVGEHESSETILRAAADSKARFVFTGSESALEKVRNAADRIPGLERIITFSDAKIGEDEKVIPFKAVLKFGAMKRKSLGDKLVEIANGILPDDPAAVFYDFNSNGIRKKEITHGGVIEAIILSSEKLSFIAEEDQAFSCLPFSGCFETFANYLGVYMGIRIVVAESREDFFEDVLEVKPTLIFETKNGVEDICGRILSGVQKKSPDERLRNSLGGKVKYIITDSPPSAEAKDIFSKSGITPVVITELAKL